MQQTRVIPANFFRRNMLNLGVEDLFINEDLGIRNWIHAQGNAGLVKMQITTRINYNNRCFAYIAKRELLVSGDRKVKTGPQRSRFINDRFSNL
jgi:hypothetical protein